MFTGRLPSLQDTLWKSNSPRLAEDAKNTHVFTFFRFVMDIANLCPPILLVWFLYPLEG